MRKRFGAFLRFLLLLLCVSGICYSGWKLWQIYHTYQEGKDLYAELSALAVTETGEDTSTDLVQQPDAVTESGEVEVSGTEETEIEIGITVDFAALQEINADVIGWIYGPDTDISYPVVQGSDNEYYLSHLLDGAGNKNGTIFMDVQNSADFTDQNTILYGHHMKNGTMFAGLEEYREQEYYQQHPVFYFLTPEENYQLQIFSACVISAEDEVYQIQFDSEEDFRLWLNRQIARSDIETSVTADEIVQVITLSTCAYDFDDARYVVLASLVSLGSNG